MTNTLLYQIDIHGKILSNNMANHVTIHDIEAKVGDTVKISYAYKDKDKEKLQDFEGILLSVQNIGIRQNIVVRKMTRSKIAVERIFPVQSPNLKSFTIVRASKNTRAKIFYIRDRSEREIRERLYTT